MYNLQYISKRNIIQTALDAEKDFYCDRKLKINEFSNAVIAPRDAGGPGVFYKNDYIKDSDFTKAVNEKRELITSDIQFIDEDVVFAGTLAKTYGHVITDNLKHVWILLNDNKFQKLRFVYVLFHQNEPVGEAFFNICELLGKSRTEIVQINDAKRFRKVYVPEQCFFCEAGGNLEQSGDRYYTK